MTNLSLAAVVAMMAASAAGGFVQATIGFGFALVAVPVLALVRPDAVPATILLMALPMTIVMAVRERSHVDTRGVALITFGRLFGALIGVAVLVSVPSTALSVLVGALIVLAATVSAAGLDLRPTTGTTIGAGVVSGIMGTTAAIGGPALAVVYQRRPGPELRSTLALSFVIGLVVSIVALAIAGRLQAWQLVLAVELLPALLVGVWVGARAARAVDRAWLRPAVLVFAGVAGAVIALRALFGG